MRISLAPVVLAAVIAATCADYRDSAGFSGGDSELSRLGSTLSAIESALNFYGRHLESINLDGVIGMRIVEGQFSGLLARHWTQLPLELVTRLKEIQQLATSVADAAIEFVKRRTPNYFATAGLVVSGHHFWDTFYPRRRITGDGGDVVAESPSPADGGGGGSGHQFSEKFSDSCIVAFAGANGKPRCTISKDCWQVMAASEGRHGYELTHQLFYLVSGIQLNCLQNLTAMAARGEDSLAGMLDRRFTSGLADALALEKLDFPPRVRDLFMEQIGLFGLAGYTDIAKPRWLDRILGWQNPGQGCYEIFPGEKAPQAVSRQTYGYNRRRRRRKRAEESMGAGGCLSHRTSVALAALTTYVRRSIEDGVDGI